jgi:hypothetical protein
VTRKMKACDEVINVGVLRKGICLK